MKTSTLLPFLAGLALVALPATRAANANARPDNVTVIFQDQDKFSDVFESGTNHTSTYFLDQLRDCLVENASPLLAAGQKLVITVTDVDLAGETRFNQPHQIRVMREIYYPRVTLQFQLLGADGQVLKEGERHLRDQDYMLQAGRPGSSEPLFYDKQMLKGWVQREFKTKS
jgi:Protein of unknown function (DUF3016)